MPNFFYSFMCNFNQLLVLLVVWCKWFVLTVCSYFILIYYWPGFIVLWCSLSYYEEPLFSKKKTTKNSGIFRNYCGKCILPPFAISYIEMLLIFIIEVTVKNITDNDILCSKLSKFPKHLHNEELKKWWKVWSTSLRRSSWGNWDCLAYKEAQERETLLFLIINLEYATKWGRSLLSSDKQ